jgi:hypothetical protein
MAARDRPWQPRAGFHAWIAAELYVRSTISWLLKMLACLLVRRVREVGLRHRRQRFDGVSRMICVSVVPSRLDADRIDNLAQRRFKRRQCRRGVHMRLGVLILLQRLEVLSTPPLCVIDDLGAIETLVNAGRHESRYILHCLLGSVDRQLGQPLLIVSRDVKTLTSVTTSLPFAMVAMLTPQMTCERAAAALTPCYVKDIAKYASISFGSAWTILFSPS